MPGWHWFVHLMGWDSVTDHPYAFSSGSGFLLIAWLGTVALWWWRTSCKATWWCPLHAAHDLTDPDTGVTHRLCWVHHPDVRRKNLTRARIAEIQRRRHLYVGSKPGKG